MTSLNDQALILEAEKFNAVHNWYYYCDVNLFTGPTERKFFHNHEDIVRAGLPFAKVREYYSDRELAEHFLLNKLTFCVEAQKV